MKQSVKYKLILAFVVAIALPLSILGYLSYKATEELVYEGYEESNLELVKEVEKSVEYYMDGFESSAELFADTETAKTIYESLTSKKFLKAGFKRYVEHHDDVMSAYMGTEKKEMLDPLWTDMPDDYDPTSRDWYQLAKTEEKTVWTQPYVDAETNEVIITVASPVFGKSKRLIGVIGIDVSLSALAGELNQIQIGQSGYPVLVGKDMTILTHKDPSLIGVKVPVVELVEAMSQNDSGIVNYVWKEEEKFATYKRIVGVDWNVLTTMNKSEVHVLTRPIMFTTMILAGICTVLGILFAIFLARRLVQPLINLEETMNIVKDGDLTIRSDVRSNDEVGRMASNFNIMLDHFSDMLSKSKDVAQKVAISAEDLASNSEEVSASSDEVARTVDEIAQGSSDQALETEKGAELIGNLAQKILILTENGQNMSSAAKIVTDANDEGLEVMADLQVKTDENNASTLRIEKAIVELESKSAQIGTILETITSIADQTNLLALNASIEAARAGEHGRGFAVVADEIRKLAEGSSEAAGNIRGIVSDIQQESQNTVEIMSEVKERSEDQNHAVEAVGNVFEQISKSTGQITALIDEVSIFVNEMNQDKENIVASMEEISAVSEQSAAASEEVTASVQQQTSAIEEVAKSAEMLNMMADELQMEINKFKI